MSVPTESWNESSPAGSDLKSAGDNRIRQLKTQIREVVDVDHKFDSSGQDADMGKHNRCSFLEAADLGTGAEGKPILGAQTVSGKAELVFTDEDDNDIQITNAGAIKAESLAGVYPAANVAAIANIMNLIYPVGSIVYLGVSTNPGTLFGVGTWTAIAAKFIVGKHSSGTFDTLDATGGAETHTLTTDEIPAHTHTIATQTTTNGGGSGDIYHSASSTTGNKNTGSTGGGSAHNNLPPYIVKYIWQRTA